MNIKERIKNTKVLYPVAKFIIKFYENVWKRSFFYWVCYKNPLFWIGYFIRKVGIGTNKYKKLESLKNSENGRCFIVATGPSLTMEDLQKLKGEKTIGLNSLCKVFDKTGWETSYYVIQDHGVFLKLLPELSKMNQTKFIHADQKFKKSELEKVVCDKYVFPRYYGNHLWNRRHLKTGFSDDVSMIVHEGYTVAFVALQMAAYMGFDEIYLVGTDCNYSKDETKQHFVSSGYYATNYATIGNEMIFAYGEAKKALDEKGIKVYNATRGGMLEVFPRVDLDEVLSEKENVSLE